MNKTTPRPIQQSTLHKYTGTAAKAWLNMCWRKLLLRKAGFASAVHPLAIALTTVAIFQSYFSRRLVHLQGRSTSAHLDRERGRVETIMRRRRAGVPRARAGCLLVYCALGWNASHTEGWGLPDSVGALHGHDRHDRHASDAVSATLPPPVEMPTDDDAGGWRWEMPDRQEDLAVGGDGERVCMNCAGPLVVQGVSAAKLQGKWVAFFCKHCAPHLSVRNNAQVPVTWTGPTANITGDLTMLPLYKRCRRCRRWATFGPSGPVGVKRHITYDCLP